MNCLGIMDESVLMRVIEPSPNSSIQEDFAMAMVTLKDIFQLIDALHVMNVVLSNITKFRKGSECLYHLIRDIPFDCW